MKIQEKGQIIIILYRAYILDCLLDFLKLSIKIILLSRPDPVVESACLWSKAFRNESLQKMVIIHHENLRKKPNYHQIIAKLLWLFIKHIFSIFYSIF